MIFTRDRTMTEQGMPKASGGSRFRRPGRAIAFLAAALILAVGSYVVGPLLRPSPAPRPAVAPGVGVPGDVAPLTGAGAPGPAAAGTGLSVDDRLPIADRIAFWAGRVAARPDDFLSLAQLASVQAEQARLTIDLDAYQRALSDVQQSLAIVPAYPPTIRVRGSLRFTLHDFAGALADAKTVLTALPDDATALALLGDASIELGRPADAVAAYARLAATSPGPWLDIRRARLASATGDPIGALALARSAAAAAPVMDPAEQGFYDYAVGEYARLAGDAATARTGYEAALAIRSTDVAALVGLARIDAAAGRPSDAIAGLRAAAAIAPQPDTLEMLGDLLAAGGDQPGGDTQFKTVRFIERLGAIQGAVYDRQLLRFELDHGGATTTVLSAAQASATVRPDSTGHDTVAWALYRLGRFDEAAAEIGQARSYGADDARLRYHDGAIAIARGDRATGDRLLQSALALGPALDPTERAEAQRLLGG